MLLVEMYGIVWWFDSVVMLLFLVIVLRVVMLEVGR